MNNEEKLLSEIFNIGRLIKGRIWESKCLAGFTNSEMEVLKFLDGKKDVTMKSISDYLCIKPSSATPVIENLVKKYNLKRVKNLQDRRELRIVLTEKGRKALKEKHKKIHDAIKKIFRPLNEKDKNNLIKILKKISENHETIK